MHVFILCLVSCQGVHKANGHNDQVNGLVKVNGMWAPQMPNGHVKAYLLMATDPADTDEAQVCIVCFHCIVMH